MKPSKALECDLLLVDGSNLLYRLASIISSSVDGDGARLVYAFVNALLKLHAEFGGVVVICWESGKRETLERTKLFPEYKQRKPNERRQAVADLIFSQTKNLRRLLDTLSVTQAQSMGWEGDDVMASIAHWGELQGHQVGIFTSDNDMLQCVTDSVFVIKPKTDGFAVVKPIDVKKILGVNAEAVPLLRALAGDSSDKIPGVKGIGQKGAERLLDALGNLENIEQAVVDNAKPNIPRFSDSAWKALRKSVTDGQLALWLKLATVNRQTTISMRRSRFNKSMLIKQLTALKFRNLLSFRRLDRLQQLGEARG